jgi:hypothetical protein
MVITVTVLKWKLAEKLSRIFCSGRVGYLKVTFLNSIFPDISPTGLAEGSSSKILGVLSIIL